MQNLGKILLLIFILTLGNFNFAAGERLNLNPGLSLNINPLDTLDKAGIKTIEAGDMFDALKLNFPTNLNINIDTGIPISPKANESQGLSDSNNIDLRQFLTPRNVSSNDLGEAVKAVVTLVIEIFLVVISITSQVLRLILNFLR